jgi:5-methyltetrahydropteroyltriglutamate--homocysteine methyltransferase
MSVFDPLRPAVETAVGDQIAAGIDIISDGQVRGDMIGVFTSKLPGIRDQQVVGKVQPAAGPITVADTKYAISKAPKVKGIITGPTTLAYGLHISTPMYRGKDDLVPDLAAALLSEARALEAAGVTLLQIDEPILSTGIADLSVAKQAIDSITAGLRTPVCLHVCGGLGNIIDELLKFNVNVFDFEFANNEANLDLLSRRDLGGRMLGYGCVDSATDRIESTAEIRKRIEKGVETFDPKILLIDPDCGLRMRTREAAYAKLKYMCDATKEVRLAL